MGLDNLYRFILKDSQKKRKKEQNKNAQIAVCSQNRAQIKV